MNQTFVKKFFKQARIRSDSAFGNRPKSPGDFEIVGVVEDTAYTSGAVEGPPHVLSAADAAPAERQGSPIEKDMSLYAGAIVIADGATR